VTEVYFCSPSSWGWQFSKGLAAYIGVPSEHLAANGIWELSDALGHAASIMSRVPVVVSVIFPVPHYFIKIYNS